MAAGIGRRQHKIAVQLLRGIDLHEQRLAVIGQDSAAIVVQHELGIDQVTMILEEPVHAIRGAAFLIGGQGENNVAAWNVSFFLHADQRCRHDGVAILHVARAAAVVVAVLLDELKRIGRPILAPRFYHVEMADQQDWLVLARPMQADHHVLLLVICVRTQHLNVAVGESGIVKALGHRFRSRGYAAHRVRRIDFDQLFENVERQLSRRFVRWRQLLRLH